MRAVRYDTIKEFNVDSKAEYTANLAHVRQLVRQLVVIWWNIS